MCRIAFLIALISLAALPSTALAGDPAGLDQYSENVPTADGKKGKPEEKTSDPAAGPAPVEPVAVDDPAAAAESTSKGDGQRKAKRDRNSKESRSSRNETEKAPEVVTLAASSDGGGGIGFGILFLMGASLVLAAGIGVARHRGDMAGGSKSE